MPVYYINCGVFGDYPGNGFYDYIKLPANLQLSEETS